MRAITPEELVVGVYSDYGELKRIKYVIDIDTEVKLVSRTELEPEGIPADLP
ncbi:MAG: hypothetical protein RI563_12505 [Thiohalophilus sp.]|uniref:hypothetical protein n=1 Tax=Thiohalophilus sp. TaxID=3028392 RepID=UPI00286FDE29|nr:hypothetical protein [Thiohalophilus sp.]MDR9437695.1 hypothetical protein [Thiohalophilus sp.]